MNKQPVKPKDVRLDELEAIVERAKGGPLSVEDCDQLRDAVRTLAFLTQELEQKGVTITQLRKMIFGPYSEKTKRVLGEEPGPEQGGDGAPAAGASPGATGDDDSDGAQKSKEEGSEPDGTPAEEQKKKRKGHGRTAAAEYKGAEKVHLTHGSLHVGDRCPGCDRGNLYALEPATLVRVRGVAPLSATVYGVERLRCSGCGHMYKAETPAHLGEKKYDETATSMIGLLRYGVGVPHNRIERLGRDLEIPMPAATQWELVEEAAVALEPAWEELVYQAAQGVLVNIDDTHAKVLELNEQIQEELAAGVCERSGVFTSGALSTSGDRRIALFYTGRKHAGENLAEMLRKRKADLTLPIVMCDALSRNTSGDIDAMIANCLAHARRHFVDVVDSFPDEVKHVLEVLRDVYRHDDEAREAKLSDEERLRLHQKKSKPLMDDLEKWLQVQFDERKVEPNSTIGGAIKYMQNHWKKLTLFLEQPGAPLDNNAAERMLKRAIMHRKNSLFYKTANGARVGDMFMSLIYTAELNEVNPFEYLVALQRHAQQVRNDREDWMPWNYAETLNQQNVRP